MNFNKSQFLRTISNDPDLVRVAYNYEYTQMLYFSFLFSLFVFVSAYAQPVNILVYWPVNIQLLHLNNIERGEAKLSSILLYSAP